MAVSPNCISCSELALALGFIRNRVAAAANASPLEKDIIALEITQNLNLLSELELPTKTNQQGFVVYCDEKALGDSQPRRIVDIFPLDSVSGTRFCHVTFSLYYRACVPGEVDVLDPFKSLAVNMTVLIAPNGETLVLNTCTPKLIVDDNQKTDGVESAISLTCKSEPEEVCDVVILSAGKDCHSDDGYHSDSSSDEHCVIVKVKEEGQAFGKVVYAHGCDYGYEHHTQDHETDGYTVTVRDCKDPKPKTTFLISLLDGENVVLTPGSSVSADDDGSGKFTLEPTGLEINDQGQVLAEVKWSLAVDSLGALTSGIIYQGVAGTNGPVVATLFNTSLIPPSPVPDPLTGLFYLPVSTLDNMIANPEQFYIQVATDEFPEGAIRGQLELSKFNPHAHCDFVYINRGYKHDSQDCKSEHSDHYGSDSHDESDHYACDYGHSSHGHSDSHSDYGHSSDHGKIDYSDYCYMYDDHNASHYYDNEEGEYLTCDGYGGPELYHYYYDGDRYILCNFFYDSVQWHKCEGLYCPDTLPPKSSHSDSGSDSSRSHHSNNGYQSDHSSHSDSDSDDGRSDHSYHDDASDHEVCVEFYYYYCDGEYYLCNRSYDPAVGKYYTHPDLEQNGEYDYYYDGYDYYKCTHKSDGEGYTPIYTSSVEDYYN